MDLPVSNITELWSPVEGSAGVVRCLQEVGSRSFTVIDGGRAGDGKPVGVLYPIPGWDVA